MFALDLASWRQFREQGSGRLINITGRGERGPVKHAALYCASKSWLRTFTLSLAAEQKGGAISAHTFNPGMMYTELTARPRVLRGNEEAIAQVRKSFQQVHALTHQHIGKTLGMYVDPEHGPYIVMDLVPGITLAKLARERREKSGPLTLKNVFQE